MKQKDKQHDLGRFLPRMIARAKSHVSRNTPFILSSQPSLLTAPILVSTEDKTKSAGDFASNIERSQPPYRVELPVDVLECILDFVSTKKTLQSFARCCHRFYQVVRPRLFTRISISFDLCDFGKAESRCRLRKFLLLLLARPCNFAHFVQHVKLYGYTSEDHDPRHPVNHRPEKADHELAMAAKRYVDSPINASTKLARIGVNDLTFSFGNPVTRLVLLLNLLPQIRNLHIEMPGERILADDVLSLDAFSELQRITLEWIPPIESYPLTSLHGRYLDQLRFMPSLQKACLIKFTSKAISSHPGDQTSYGRETSPLKCLELRESRLAQDDRIYEQLNPSLETFVYEHSWIPILCRQSVLPKSIIWALAEHNTSLESLWLDFTKDIRHWLSAFNSSCFSKIALRKLPQFKVLRHLCFPLEFFLHNKGLCEESFRQLPASLETLVLICHTNERVAVFPAFIDRFSQLLFDSRSDPDRASFYKVLPYLKRAVIIANVDHFVWCSPTTLARTRLIPNLEVIFAHEICDENHESLEDEVCTNRVRDIEDLMGLTRLGPPRWEALSIAALEMCF